ncbi:MAG: hypothetical protein IT289_05375 [Oligoflexia bacterium]|nr:hypothetical protein [Oligoflexia bacterium]
MKAFLIAAVFLFQFQSASGKSDTNETAIARLLAGNQSEFDTIERLAGSKGEACSGLLDKYELILQAEKVCRSEGLFSGVKTKNSGSGSKYKLSLDGCLRELNSCQTGRGISASPLCTDVRLAAQNKELTENEKDLREKKDEAERKMEESKQAVLAAQSEWDEQKNQLQDELNRLNAEKENVLPEFQREISELNYAKRQQAEAIRSEMESLIQEKKNIMESERLAVLKEINDKKRAAMAECWQQSIDRVTLELQQEQAQAASGTLSYGSLGELFDRAQSDRISEINDEVNRYYQTCLRDGRLESIDQEREVALSQLSAKAKMLDAQIRGKEGELAGVADFGQNVGARDSAVAKLKQIYTTISKTEGRLGDVNVKGQSKLSQAQVKSDTDSRVFAMANLSHSGVDQQLQLNKAQYLARGAPDLDEAREKLNEAKKLVREGSTAFARFYGRPSAIDKTKKIESADDVQDSIQACYEQKANLEKELLERLQRRLESAEKSTEDQKASTNTSRIENICKQPPSALNENTKKACDSYSKATDKEKAAEEAVKELGLNNSDSGGSSAPASTAAPAAGSAARASDGPGS